jgi:hypothetical protein
LFPVASVADVVAQEDSVAAAVDLAAAVVVSAGAAPPAIGKHG